MTGRAPSTDGGERNGAGPAKSRIDRRLVVYPALYLSLALLAWLCIQGGDKLRESVADGLVNIALFIVLGVLAARGGERAWEHYMNIRLGPGADRPPDGPATPPIQQEGEPR
jgi:hypothetical protein